MKNLLILSDKEGWHSRQIEASAIKENFLVQIKDIRDLSISLEDGCKFIVDEKNKKINPDCVFVRFIPGGSLEEIVIYLNILKVMKLNGCDVVNDAHSIETTVDKSLTTIKLRDNQVLTPDTWIIRGFDRAYNKVEQLIKNFPIIYKPLFGSQGTGIELISSLQDFENINNESNIYYFQKFIETKPSHDYRVLIITGKRKVSIFAMTRYGQSYINNFSMGAKCSPFTSEKTIIERSIEVSKIFNMPICGVDLIKDKNDIYVIEINSIPAWKGLQSVSDSNIASAIIQNIFNTRDIEKKILHTKI